MYERSCFIRISIEQTSPHQAARRTKAQRKTAKAYKAQENTGTKRNVSSSPATATYNKMSSPSMAQSSRIRRVTSSGTARSNNSKPLSTVTPGTVTKTKLSKGVQFNLKRNSFAQYNKDNPQI